MDPSPSLARVNSGSPASAIAKLWSEEVADFLFRHRLALFLYVAFVYLISYNAQWQMGPDSALYLTLGRNLALGRGYTYHGEPHGLVYPGLPCALAILYKIFGPRAYIPAADGLMLLCGFGSLLLTYRLMHLAFDRVTAVVVTLGVANTREFFHYCYDILTDMPYLFGVMLFLAGHEAIFHTNPNRPKARWWDWLFFISGLVIAISTRPTMLGLLGIWIAIVLWNALIHRRNRALAAWSVGLTILAIALFFCFDPRHAATPARSLSYESDLLKIFLHGAGNQLFVVAPANARQLFFITAARAAFGIKMGSIWISAFFGALILAAGVALIRLRALWGLWVAVSILMMILVVPHERYVLQILPLLVLAWWRTILAIERRLPRTLGHVAFVSLFVLGSSPNGAMLGAIAVHQRMVPFLAHYSQGEYVPYQTFGNELPKYVAPDDPVFCPRGYARVLTFLSDRNVYEMGEPLPTDLSAHPPLVIVDPTDTEMAPWLTGLHLSVIPQPLLTIPRAHLPALTLYPTQPTP
jgi:hypothetical protein